MKTPNDEINDKLKAMYRDHLRSFDSECTITDYPNPILIQCTENWYRPNNADNIRVLYIGVKGPKNWCPEIEAYNGNNGYKIKDDLLEAYQKYNVSEHITDTDFFELALEIHKRINPNPESEFLWTAIKKLEPKKKNALPLIRKGECKALDYDIVEHEILRTKPNYVVFIIGSKNDEMLNKIYEDQVWCVPIKGNHDIASIKSDNKYITCPAVRIPIVRAKAKAKFDEVADIVARKILHSSFAFQAKYDKYYEDYKQNSFAEV